MKKLVTLVAFGASVMMFAAAPASADYMSDCDKLIATYDDCRAGGGRCTAEAKRIEAECKCHVQKGGEWRVVKASLTYDGVCDPEWPDGGKPIPTPTKGGSGGGHVQGPGVDYAQPEPRGGGERAPS